MQTLDIRGLDLSLLLVFDGLARLRSVTAAADALALSQPNVSYALKKLRGVFDDDLFLRSGHGMRPTAKAQELFEPIARVLAILKEEVLSPSGFDPALSRRAFVINTTDIGEMVFLPPLLKLFRDSAPQLSVECVCLPTAELVEAMRDGKVDLAIGYLPGLAARGIYTQSLFRHPFVCLLRDGHPLLADGLSLREYESADHVGLVGEGHGQRKFEEQIAKAGIPRRITFRSQHFMNIPFIVRDSDLVATVPKVIAVAFQNTAGLRAVQPPFAIPPIPIKQYWSERQHKDPGQIWLRHAMAELFLGADPTERVELWKEPAAPSVVRARPRSTGRARRTTV